jgi:sporulation protein YlmC with PRC-barrel domain
VEDIVLLLPWSQVESFDEDGFRLLGIHPDLPMETAEGKLFLRADLLDKQMLDSEGNRIQRVDDIYMERKVNELRVIGLEVSRGLLLGSSTLRHFVDGLRKKYGHTRDIEMIPLEAVQRVEEEAVVVGEVFHTED